MASINKLASGKWRVQVRCKGLYLSNSFSLRKAEMWAGRIEREIDLGQKPAPKHKDGIKTVSDLIDLHIADMEEVGKEIGRSTGFSLDLLRARLGKLKIADLNREQVKERPELERRAGLSTAERGSHCRLPGRPQSSSMTGPRQAPR